MRLYRNDDMIGQTQWAGTRENANRLFGRNRWVQVDVPTDKPGLLAFLNARDDSGRALIDPQTLVSGETMAETRPAPAAPITLTDVEEFIQNAGHAAMASITSNTLFRFKELAQQSLTRAT